MMQQNGSKNDHITHQLNVTSMMARAVLASNTSIARGNNEPLEGQHLHSSPSRVSHSKSRSHHRKKIGTSRSNVSSAKKETALELTNIAAVGGKEVFL